jgi:DNA-binding NtrC family response regulator
LAARPEPGGRSIVRLRPIRVLLIGRDRRFLRTAEVLLRRHRCEVTSTDRPSELLDRVALQRPNIVVVDASDSLVAAARAVAALEALPSPVSAVVVCDHPPDKSLRHLHVLPKWGAFDELLSEVERRYGEVSPTAPLRAEA